MADEFYEDNHDNDSPWWDDKFYEDSYTNDDYVANDDDHHDHQYSSSNNDGPKNFNPKHSECLKRMLLLYRKIGKQIDQRFWRFIEKNPDDLIVKLTFKLKELNEFNNYIRQLETIHQEIFEREESDNSTIANTANTTNTTTTTKEKHDNNKQTFCSQIQQIDVRVTNLVRRMVIEPKKSFQNKWSFSLPIWSLSLQRFNRRNLVYYITPVVALLIQIILFIYYFNVNIRNCINLIIIDLVITGALWKYYLEKQIEHERSLSYGEYNPDLIELSAQYFTAIFSYIIMEFIEKLQPQLQRIFEQNIVDSWNPMIIMKNFILLSISFFILYMLSPMIMQFFYLLLNIIFNNNHRHQHHHTILNGNDNNNNDDDHRLRLQQSQQQQQPQPIQHTTIVHQHINFHNNHIDNLHGLNPNNRLPPSSSTILPPSLMMRMTSNEKRSTTLKDNNNDDDEEYFSTEE